MRRNRRQNVQIRKSIALGSFVVVTFVIVFILITGKSVPAEVWALLSPFTGYIGYYFGQSTMREGVEEGHGKPEAYTVKNKGAYEK